MHLILLFLLLLFTKELAADSIAIVTYKAANVPAWDPDSIHSGITGSEEAVIYMSQCLADLGHEVVVLGNPPPHSRHSRADANPRFADIDLEKNSTFDIAISWRMPWAGPALKQRADKVYFWPHDTPPGQKIDTQIVNSFDGVLWLSQWQRKEWIANNSSFRVFKPIFGNGINLEQFNPVKERANPYSCIYGSNYARGLEILLQIWPEIKGLFPRATLDIYYGWQHWGLLSPEKESYMRAQVLSLAPLGVKEHGLVSHAELNRAYEQASFWTYPCIAAETFCITALRAQKAGAVPVIIDGTALTETVLHGYKCKHEKQYLQTLIKALSEAETIKLKDREQMGKFIEDEYTWAKIALEWNQLFNNTSPTN